MRRQRLSRAAVSFVVAVASIVGLQSLPARIARAACGTFRADVQSVTDTPGQIDTSPRKTAVESILASARPDAITSTTPRIVGAETHVFRLRARLVGATRTADGEIEAVMGRRDNLHRRLVVRFHDPGCIVGSSLETEQNDARTSFLNACGPTDAGVFTRMQGMVAITGVGFWGERPGDRWAAASGIELNPVIGFSGRCWQVPDPLRVMIVGDSVPTRLIDPLSQAEGWLPAEAGAGGCPASGEEPTDRQGASWTTDFDCRPIVRPRQRLYLDTYHPDIVLWWDRQSSSHFLDLQGNLVRSGTERFWHERRRTLRQRVRVLSAQGAMVVLIGTEPVSMGASSPDPQGWPYFLIHHYFEVTMRWNHILRAFARAHPEQARFISVTPKVCHRLASPCNDAIDGVYARPDGQHYEGPGKRLALDVLGDLLRPIARRMTP